MVTDAQRQRVQRFGPECWAQHALTRRPHGPGGRDRPDVLVSTTVAEGAPRHAACDGWSDQMVSCPRLHAELEGLLPRERFLR